jgi:hypothetical protein
MNNLQENKDYSLINGVLTIFDHVTEIGDNFLKNDNSITKLIAPNLTTVGNYFLFYNKTLAELIAPNLTTVGDYFLCYNKTLAEVSFKNFSAKVLKIDRTTFIANSTKSIGDVTVMNGYVFKSMTNDVINKYVCFVASFDGFYAHSDTAKKAIEDVKFKSIQEKLAKSPIYNDTMITVNHYRAITGACEMGCNEFIKQHNLTDLTEIKASDLVVLLEKSNAYGVEKFKSLLPDK